MADTNSKTETNIDMVMANTNMVKTDINISVSTTDLLVYL